MLGNFQVRTAAETNRALLGLLARHPGRIRTITADNGTEFHWLEGEKRYGDGNVDDRGHSARDRQRQHEK